MKSKIGGRRLGKIIFRTLKSHSRNSDLLMKSKMTQEVGKYHIYTLEPLLFTVYSSLHLGQGLEKVLCSPSQYKSLARAYISLAGI